MKHHLNTLFVTTQGAYLSREGEALLVRVEKQTRLRLPIHTLGGIVCFGRVGCSPSLMALCGQRGVALTFMTERGAFLARVSGFTPGNVLLRREQYRRADNPSASAHIARAVVAAKILNCRAVLLRNLRDYPAAPGRPRVESAAERLAQSLPPLLACADVDIIRGIEGDSARIYFDVFSELIVAQKDRFIFAGRSRRPPLDPVNALLSFLYTLLAADLRAACESAGLDAAVGYLHADRPGRPSLALDLMEEFRAFLADRLALSLINRRQIQPDDFTTAEGGGVLMSDKARKEVLIAWQKRKQEELIHPFLEEKTTVGLLPHLQARLLARHLRGDFDAYPSFIWR